MTDERGEPRADGGLIHFPRGSVVQGAGLGNPAPTSEFDRFGLLEALYAEYMVSTPPVGVKPYVARDLYRAFRG